MIYHFNLNRNIIVFVAIVLFIMNACNNDNPIEDINTGHGSIIDTIYNGYIDIPDSLAVTDIYETTDFTVITFEEDWTYYLSNDNLYAYQIDEDYWTIELQYTDNTTQTIPYLGEQIRISNDSVTLNPSGYAPLSALLSFTTPLPGKVKITIKSKNTNTPDITGTFKEYTESHEIPIYGLYADFLNTVEIEFLDFYGNTRTQTSIEIQTDELGKIKAGTMNVLTNNYPDEDKGKLFLIKNAIFDAAGEVRWYYSNTQGYRFYLIYDNLIAIQRYAEAGKITDSNQVEIINLMGENIKYYTVPNGMHHEINEKEPGGNLLVASHRDKYQSIEYFTEDLIVEIDRETGEIVRSWNLYEIFDPTRKRLTTEQVNDWCHLNSIEYDPSDTTLIISSKLQYFVAKIHYYTGEIKWICGNHENWSEEFQPYLLTPTNFDTTVHVDADWTYEQHMPRLTPEGSLIIYDNGIQRPGGAYSRAVEFEINPEDMTVTKLWEYTLPNLATALGSVQKLDNGNVLIGHGAKGYIYELNQQKEIIFKSLSYSFYRVYPFEFY